MSLRATICSGEHSNVVDSRQPARPDVNVGATHTNNSATPHISALSRSVTGAFPVMPSGHRPDESRNKLHCWNNSVNLNNPPAACVSVL